MERRKMIMTRYRSDEMHMKNQTLSPQTPKAAYSPSDSSSPVCNKVSYVSVEQDQVGSNLRSRGSSCRVWSR
jgi:hypothetical protein